MRISRTLAVLAAVAFVMAAPTKTFAGGLLTVEPTSIDFGTLNGWYTNLANRTVWLHNAGDSMVYVVASQTSGAPVFSWMCTVWQPCFVYASTTVESLIGFAAPAPNSCWAGTVEFTAYSDPGLTSWSGAAQVAVQGCRNEW